MNAKMFHKIIQPPKALNDIVKYFWLMESHSKESVKFAVRSMCDCSSGIVVQHHEGKSVFIKDNHRLLTSFIHGPYTTPSLSLADNTFRLSGVVFKPQALHVLFRTNAFEFTDRMIPLNEFAKKSLSERLIGATARKQRIQILSNFLHHKTSDKTKADSDPIISESIWRIDSQAKGEVLTVGRLVHFSGLSKRQFERRFKQATGMLPKYYLRINRLNRAIKAMKSGDMQKLTDIVYSMGYTDQSHFSRDTKELTGVTPKHLFQKISRRDLVNHFTLTE